MTAIRFLLVGPIVVISGVIFAAPSISLAAYWLGFPETSRAIGVAFFQVLQFGN